MKNLVNSEEAKARLSQLRAKPLSKKSKQVKLKENTEGCLLVVSHRLNQDGYFRKRIEGCLQMAHRWLMGNVPEGYEVDHICRNRNCVNPEHLQILEKTAHVIKTNKERYADRKEEARCYWNLNKVTGVKLSELFSVSFSTTCRWIREWRNV